MPDALGLAVVGDLAQVMQQPVPGAHLKGVEVGDAAAGQHRGIKPRRQRRRSPLPGSSCSQYVFGWPCRTYRTGRRFARTPPGTRSREVARRVHRPGMGRRVGERLHRHQPHPERPLVVAGQRARHRGQRPRRRVRYRRHGRQHAQPLVAAGPAAAVAQGAVDCGFGDIGEALVICGRSSATGRRPQPCRRQRALRSRLGLLDCRATRQRRRCSFRFWASAVARCCTMLKVQGRRRPGRR